MTETARTLIVAGDFGGAPRAAGRRLQRVDRDNFDAVLRAAGVRFEATVPNRLVPRTEPTLRVELSLNALAAFEPDAIAHAIPEARRVLERRDHVPVEAQPEEPPAPRMPPVSAAPASSGSLLDAILDRESPREVPEVAELARRAAEPLRERAPAGLGEWQAMIDRLLAAQVLEVLYHPRFRALEASWRGLARLVARCETGPELSIRLVDVPVEQAATVLRDEVGTPGGTAVAALIADYAFGPSAEDIGRLRALGEVAATVGAPLVAQATPAVLGLGDARELGDPAVRQRIGSGAGLDAWRAFRGEPAARHVALCLPRVLVRLPYGPAGLSVEYFALDEALGAEDREGFVWGNASVAFGEVVARALTEEGPGAALEGYATLEDLPAHVLPDGTMLPCAEVLMSEATIAAVAGEGVIPLASFRDRDVARFYGIGTVDDGAFGLC